MRVFIGGMEEYIGWPLAKYLARAETMRLADRDLFFGREWIEEVRSLKRQSDLSLAPSWSAKQRS